MEREDHIMAAGGQPIGRIDIREQGAVADAAQVFADAVLANTLSSSTVSIYKNHIKHMKEWARANCDIQSIFETNGQLRVPMCSQPARAKLRQF
jgi:hypothetical protein